MPVGTTIGSAQCLVRLWIHARCLQGAFGRISTIFHVPGWTRDPEVNSRRFSCVRCLEEVAALVVDYGSGMRFSWFCWFFAPRAVFPTIAGRSKFLLMSSCTWKSVHFFYEPPCIFSICHSRFFALVDFLGPSSTHSCECSRAGGAGVAGSFFPGDSAPGLCQLVTMVLWTYTLS